MGAIGANNYVSPALVSPTAYNIAQYTLANVVYQAYRMGGGLSMAGQGINPSEQQEILDITNHFVDGLKLEALFCQFLIRTVVAVTTNKYVYSVGPGQDWDIERPEKINTAGFILNYGQGQTESELPMRVIVSYEQYAEFVAKQVTSSFPLVLYYQATTPYGSGTVWPVPSVDSASSSGAYVALYTPGYMQEFNTLDDPIVVPHGYREFMMYNLAIRIHQRPPYSKQPMDQSVRDMAALYKSRIQNAQITPLLALPDEAALSPLPGISQPVKAWTPY